MFRVKGFGFKGLGGLEGRPHARVPRNPKQIDAAKVGVLLSRAS